MALHLWDAESEQGADGKRELKKSERNVEQ